MQNLFFYSKLLNSDMEHSGNFGDLLSLYIYKFIKGTYPINYMDLETDSPKGNEYHYFIIGSILNKINDYSIVWGSGFLYNYETVNIRNIENIKCVRGPLSKNKIEKEFNITTDIKMGDPGLLISKMYKPSKSKKGLIGIVPHLNEFDVIREIFETSENVKIINLFCKNPSKDIENVIDDINECELILSSSLHGIVVAHSYDIPVFWFKNEYIPGDDFKFYDYFHGIYSRKEDFPIYSDKLNVNILTLKNFLLEKYVYPDLKNKRIADLEISCPF